MQKTSVKDPYHIPRNRMFMNIRVLKDTPVLHIMKGKKKGHTVHQGTVKPCVFSLFQEIINLIFTINFEKVNLELMGKTTTGILIGSWIRIHMKMIRIDNTAQKTVKKE